MREWWSECGVGSHLPMVRTPELSGQSFRPKMDSHSGAAGQRRGFCGGGLSASTPAGWCCRKQKSSRPSPDGLRDFGLSASSSQAMARDSAVDVQGVLCCLTERLNSNRPVATATQPASAPGQGFCGGGQADGARAGAERLRGWVSLRTITTLTRPSPGSAGSGLLSRFPSSFFAQELERLSVVYTV